MRTIPDLQFATIILQDRINELHPYSPQTKKLKTAQKLIERIIAQQARPILIEVYQGIVSNVSFVPTGFKYEIIDHDGQEAPDTTEQEKVDTEFSMLIREQLDNKDFWNWVATWKDTNALCKIAEEWDTETKKEAIEKIKKILSKDED